MSFDPRDIFSSSRRLLPRPSDEGALISSSSITHAKRQAVIAACVPCRKRKSKCNAGRPVCDPCIARNIDCSYETAPDETHSRAIKRKHEELAYRVSAYEEIIKLLRERPKAEVDAIIRRLRAGADIETILHFVNDADLLIQMSLVPESRHNAEYLDQEDFFNGLRAERRQAVTSSAPMATQPFIRVPAHPWTTVTDDDEAVSHLLSVYFTWQHWGYPSVDQALFVAAMNSKDLSSQFCSPLLVNTFLAVACMYTDHPSAFADGDNPLTRGTHFMEEAARLWNLEEGKPSLTNLQALPAMISCTVILGKDRVGAVYTSQSGLLATDFVKLVKKGIKRGVVDYETPDFQRSYHSALWAVFLIQTEVALAWMKPIDLRQPVLAATPEEEQLQTTITWRPYPSLNPQMTFHSVATNNARFLLYAIAADLLPLILSGNPQDSPLPGYIILDMTTRLERLLSVEQRLLQWYKNLPLEVQVIANEKAPIAAPQVDLLLAYNGFHLTAQSLVLRSIDNAHPSRPSVEDKIISTCNDIANLLQSLHRSIGLTDFSIYVVHASALAAYNLIGLLHRPKVPEIFQMVIVALTTASRRWMLARGVVKMIWITVQERNRELHLNAATRSLFKLNAVERWGKQDYRFFHMCAYPNLAVIDEKGRDFVEMGELLQEYANL